MSNPSPTKEHAKDSLPTLDSNLLKSLNSVHLPPPPSSANQNIMYNRRTNDPNRPQENEYHQSKDSSFVTPLFANKSNNPLTDISANPVLNTPPPSQLRNANIQTPTLRGRDDKENHLISPPVHSNVPSSAAAHHAMNNGQQHPQQPQPQPQQQFHHHQQPQPQPQPQQFHHQQPQRRQQQQQQQQQIPRGGNAAVGRGDTKTVAENRPTPPQFRIPEPHEMPPLVDDGKKPPFSYATLIGMAILRSPKRKLTLAQIYQWINDTFEWYRNSKSGWQNSIRHNLSLNKAFKKQERPKSDPGKGNYWLVEAGCEHQFINVKAVRRASTHHPAASTTTTTTTTTTTGTGHNELTYSTFPAAATHTKSNSTSTSASAAAAAAAAAAMAASSTKNNSASIADRQHEHSSTDEEVNDDDADDYTAFPPPPPLLPSNDANNNNTTSNNGNNGWNNEETPLKRCNTAIGLQHFSKTNFNVESPLTKRTASSMDSDFESSAFKRQRLFDDAPSWGAPQQNQNTPIIQESPGGHNYITGGGQGLILGPLKPSTMLPPPNSAQKMISPNTSLRNHRAMVKGLTSPSSMEFEDTLGSPSTRKMYNYQQHAFMSSEDDDAISRAIFGSPDKREARRRQYFEQSGVMGFDGAESVTDVFGVDVCDVVRRAIEHGDPSNSNNDDNDDNESDDDETHQPNNNDSNANDIIRFDSPIKTHGNVFSPPKMVRKNTAYF